MRSGVEENSGPGFALFGLLVGLAAGAAVYFIVEHWIDEAANERLAPTVLFGVTAFAAGLLLLAERGRQLGAAPTAAVIALILAAPTYHILIASDETANLAVFPMVFWLGIGAPLAGYLMTTLAKAALLEGAPPPYTGVFFHGLTLPLIAAGAKVFAILAAVLLYAWAGLLRAMDVNFFHELFQEPWFMFPFFGAIGGLSIAMMRGMQSVLGALRYLLLLFSRIAMPITAVFSLTFIGVLIANGPQTVLEQPYPGAMMLTLAFVGMLIFNGVYQNGEGGPPPAWLRLATLVTLLTFPVYAGLAAYSFYLRVEEYGLTPARIVGAAMNGLAALYIVVCLAGVLTELNWTGRRWMPMVAPLNTMMAVIWVVVLVGLASPWANPWAISAGSQEQRLLSGKISAADFDYGYLRFQLGAYGEAALDRLAAARDHPEAAEIREGVARARAAIDAWDYRFEGRAPEPVDEAPPEGPMQLELNPDDGGLSDETAPSR